MTHTSESQVGDRWRPDFLKLWGGQTVSQFGSQITLIALPLTAVLVLDVDAAQLGVINAALWVPFLLFALLVGAWTDRVRRLPLLIGSDLGRALLLGCIAALALSDTLSLVGLVALAFAFGTLTVVFEVAYYSLIPSLVPRGYIVTANSRLQSSASLAEMGGPSTGGVLVQVLSAPAALIADAISFVVSAVSLAGIRTEESRPDRDSEPGKTTGRIRDGLRFTYQNDYLRACLACSAFSNLFDQWLTVLFLVYAVNVLGFGAASIGLIFTAGAIGALVGSIASTSLTGRLGVGPVFVWLLFAESVALFAVPAVSSGSVYSFAVLAGAFVINGFSIAVTSIVTVSVRQIAAPASMLGRVNATYRFLSYGSIAVGAFVGGQVGHLLGLRTGLLLAVIGLLATAVGIALSPLRHLRSLDDLGEDRRTAAPPASTSSDIRCPRSCSRPLIES
jgi:MFS family permease